MPLLDAVDTDLVRVACSASRILDSMPAVRGIRSALVVGVAWVGAAVAAWDGVVCFSASAVVALEVASPSISLKISARSRLFIGLFAFGIDRVFVVMSLFSEDTEAGMVETSLRESRASMVERSMSQGKKRDPGQFEERKEREQGYGGGSSWLTRRDVLRRDRVSDFPHGERPLAPRAQLHPNSYLITSRETSHISVLVVLRDAIGVNWFSMIVFTILRSSEN